jgi:hypothetical protein
MSAGALVTFNSETLPCGSEPAVTERYGEQVRRSFLDRPDKLHFMTEEGDIIYRLFHHSERKDGIHEAEQNRRTGESTIRFRDRPDGLIEYRKQVLRTQERKVEVTPSDQPSTALTTPTTTTLHTLEFNSSEPEGFKSLSIELRNGEQFNPATDTPPILYRSKALHIAIRYQPDGSPKASNLAEVLQDQEHRRLRIVSRDSNGRPTEAVEYETNVANSDDLYEIGRLHVGVALQRFVQLERELYLNFPDYVPNETQTEAIEHQQSRLTCLAQALFGSIDNYTSDPYLSPPRSSAGSPAHSPPRAASEPEKAASKPAEEVSW